MVVKRNRLKKLEVYRVIKLVVPPTSEGVLLIIFTIKIWLK
jgi:hypothetical protein